MLNRTTPTHSNTGVQIHIVCTYIYNFLTISFFELNFIVVVIVLAMCVRIGVGYCREELITAEYRRMGMGPALPESHSSGRMWRISQCNSKYE